MLCNFCQLLGVEGEINKNEWKAHVEIHNCHLHLIDEPPTELSTEGKSIEASRKSQRGKSENWRSLAIACGDIVKKNHSSSPVDCGKCGKKLRLFSTDALLSNSFAFDHVCVHLDKPIFSCLHCDTDTRFTNRPLLQGHLLNVHKLRTITSNFRDFSGNYEEEVIDMAKQCYQNTQTKEISKTTVKRMKSENIDSKTLLPLGKNKVIRDYSQLLLRSRGVDRTIECGECGQILCVRYRHTLQHSKLINHACKHLKQSMFACNNCQNTYSCTKSMRAHQLYAHKIPGTEDNFIDSSIYYQDNILKMMGRCFGKASVVQQGSISKVKVRHFTQARTPLTNICRKLPLSRDGDGKVKCAKCGIELIAVGRIKSEVRSHVLINHACIHLDKPLFGCRLCEFRYTTRGTLSAHLQTAHAVSKAKANIIDLSTDHYPEIKEQLEQCFGHKAEIPAAASDGKPKEAKHPQRQCRLSNACRKLLDKNSIDNWIKCSICKKSLQSACFEQTKQRRYFLTNSIINHALIHLDKPMFTCRQCQHAATTRSRIIKHLGRHGRKFSRDQYTDKSAGYQIEIMAMLEKCFGEGSAVDA